MAAAQGILTARGGMTSHAALVGGRWARCASSAASALAHRLRGRRRCASTAATRCSARATPSRSTASPARCSRRDPDASRREVVQRARRHARSMPTQAPVYQLYAQLHEVGRQDAPRSACAPTPTCPTQCAQRGRLRRRGRRPLPHRAHVLRRGQDRPDARDDPRRDRRGARARALAKLLPLQRDDFEGIFRGDGRPARSPSGTLDPPLHEFLPHDDDGQRELAAEMGIAAEQRARSASRRCTSSTRCSASAAAGSASSIPRSPRCRRARSSRPRRACSSRASRSQPEVMIPLVGHVKELHAAGRDRAPRRRRTVMARPATQLPLPRRHHDRGAARRAHRRRDRRDGRVLLLRHQRPDPDDARRLARRRRAASSRRTSATSRSTPATRSRRSTATASARSCASRSSRAGGASRTLKLGICGEHGGDPASIALLRRGSGSTTSRARRSASPIARLAAAQAPLTR